MPLAAQRFVRKMRGGAQSHLLEADDGKFYIVKFQNNPQHRRILVNELVASVLLDYLQISTPETALIEIREEFLRANPEISVKLGTRSVPPAPGWHFGSLYPGNPERMAVYDFVPDALLSQVVNAREFLGVLVFDKWAGNADGRQCIFYRARVRDWPDRSNPRAGRPAFVARMIDHGFILDGPNWTFTDSPAQGCYPRKSVYHDVRSLDDFQPWLDQVVHMPVEILDRAWRRIPPQWIDGEEDEFTRVLEQLMLRRQRVPDLIADMRRWKANPFPHWT
jgi:hypothetical protein